MKQKPINLHGALVDEIFLHRKGVHCAGCREFLNLGGVGIRRVVIERIADLINNDRETLANLRLVHFCCRRKSMRNEKAEKAKRLSGGGKTHKEIAEALSLSLATVYRYLAEKKVPPEPNKERQTSVDF